MILGPFFWSDWFCSEILKHSVVKVKKSVINMKIQTLCISRISWGGISLRDRVWNSVCNRANCTQKSKVLLNEKYCENFPLQILSQNYNMFCDCILKSLRNLRILFFYGFFQEQFVNQSWRKTGNFFKRSWNIFRCFVKDLKNK